MIYQTVPFLCTNNLVRFLSAILKTLTWPTPPAYCVNKAEFDKKASTKGSVLQKSLIELQEAYPNRTGKSLRKTVGLLFPVTFKKHHGLIKQFNGSFHFRSRIHLEQCTGGEQMGGFRTVHWKSEAMSADKIILVSLPCLMPSIYCCCIYLILFFYAYSYSCTDITQRIQKQVIVVII